MSSLDDEITDVSSFASLSCKSRRGVSSFSVAVSHKSIEKSSESETSVSFFDGSLIVKESSTKGVSKSKEISHISAVVLSDFTSVVCVVVEVESSKKSKTISEDSSFGDNSSFTIVAVSQKLNKSSS
jgi:hypothetical protein